MDHHSLGYQVSKIKINSPSEIAWIVKLLENPKSLIALPGKITLHNHDCLHILLGMPTNPQGEAFVLGFTMGNDLKTKPYHILIFKLFARFIYPQSYKFTKQDLKYFDLGLKLGQEGSVKNLNQIDFSQFEERAVLELRDELRLNIPTIKLAYV
jgi:ubiquinone biosynthesis protein Coq4